MAGFTVTVGGKQYDVDAPDERTAWKWARSTHLKAISSQGVAQPPPVPFKSSGETALSGGEEFLANPYGRALVSATKPIIGIGQHALNAVGQGEGINREMKNLSDATAKARQYVGSEGVDLADLVGQSAAFALPATKLGATTTALQRMGQGAAFGAGAGAVEPVSDPQNYWGTKGGQIAGGAVAGGIVPGAWELSKALGRGVRNVAQPYMGEWGADRAAGRLAKNVAGDKADDIIGRMEATNSTVPGSMPTAGQAAVPAASAEFSALQKIAETRAPSKFYGIERSQEGARSQAIGDIAGDATTIAAARSSREALTKQLREETFEATRAVGVSTHKLMRQIRGVESQPGIRASDVVSKSLADIKDKISKFTDEDGFISARDLYTIRKEIGNTIKKNSQETANWDKRLTGGLERDLQKNIDDAIQAAGGSRWKEYLSTYSEASKPIQQMKLGQVLEAKLDPALGTRQRASGYAEALRKMGSEGELNVMTPQQINTLQMVGGDLSRDASMNQMARSGRAEALRRIGSEVPEAAPTGFFDPRISFTRGVYNRLTGGATDRILGQLGKRMDDPRKMAEIMRAARPFERKEIVDALMRYQATVPVQLGNQ